MFFISVCLSVCVSVCPSANKMLIEWVHRFGRDFRYKTAAYNTSSDPIEIGDLGFKVKITVKVNVSKMMKIR